MNNASQEHIAACHSYLSHIQLINEFRSDQAQSELRKHHIDLADCEAAFDEPMLTREDGREDYGE